MNNFPLPGGHRRSSFSKQQLHSLIYGKVCDIPSLTPKLPAATAYTPMFRHQQGFRLVVPSTGAVVEDPQSQARITCDLQVATDTGLSVARVFPANAGMNRSASTANTLRACVPRKRGDEPQLHWLEESQVPCSPQTRG